MRRELPQRDVLLVASDIDERRLLFAELQEGGYEVMISLGLVDALQRLLFRLVKPRLILLDAHGDVDATPEHVKHLSSVCGSDVLLIVIVGAVNQSAWELLRPRVTALLRRPIRINQVVDLVRQTVPPARFD